MGILKISEKLCHTSYDEKVYIINEGSNEGLMNIYYEEKTCKGRVYYYLFIFLKIINIFILVYVKVNFGNTKMK